MNGYNQEVYVLKKMIKKDKAGAEAADLCFTMLVIFSSLGFIVWLLR